MTDSDRRRLAQKGRVLNDYVLSTVEPTWSVSTVRGWYNTLVGDKYNSVRPNQKKLGRKPISQEIIDSVLQFAEHNPDWGYAKIAGTMRYLGYDVSITTIRKILSNHGIVPDPERRVWGDWERFINAQRHLIAATDFATVEILTPYGLVRQHLLFFLKLGTREVRFAGMAHNPDSNWTRQMAVNMCDQWDGFLLGMKYLIHDRDSLFNTKFDAPFESIGIEIKKLPPFSPMMNSQMENFIRAIKHECLNKLVFTSVAQLRYAVREYMKYYTHYRPHSAIGGNMINPLPQDLNGEIREISFLGGLLHGYRRETVA